MRVVLCPVNGVGPERGVGHVRRELGLDPLAQLGVDQALDDHDAVGSQRVDDLVDGGGGIEATDGGGGGVGGRGHDASLSDGELAGWSGVDGLHVDVRAMPDGHQPSAP